MKCFNGSSLHINDVYLCLIGQFFLTILDLMLSYISYICLVKLE